MEAIKKLHGRLIVSGLYRDPLSVSKVISSYALSPSNFNDARLVFDQIHGPKTFIWNTMIRGYAQSDLLKEVISLYSQMREKGIPQNHLTFIFSLKACERIPDIEAGKQIHTHIVKLGFEAYLFVSNSLIHMYGFSGGVELAQKVFDEMPERDLVSWNSLICGYAHNNRMRDVLGLYKAMQDENVVADAVTMVKVILACSHLSDWTTVDKVTKYIEDSSLKFDIYLGNTLIDLYGRRGSIDLARRIFDDMPERNLITYNTMITLCAKAGDLVLARKFFDEMPERDVISWTSMITGYSQAKKFASALKLFNQMVLAKVEPDERTLASVLSATAQLGTLDLGKSIHNYIRRSNVKDDIYVGNALIDMYCKCGCIEKAVEVFGEMREKDTVTWTSIISGMAVNGYANDALHFFSKMLSSDVKPSSVTYVVVLLACTHSGLVDKGLEYFRSMSEVHQIDPEMKHYGCMVDLFCRSGQLNQAYDFIQHMPVDPDPVVWRILLSACKQRDNVYLAEVAAKKLMEVDPSNSGNYVLMSTTYAGANRWDDSMKVREMMIDSDVQKPTGCSSIQVNSEVQDFVDTDGVPRQEKDEVLISC